MADKRDLQGRVESVNDNGVKINGTWFNYSKFFKGERTPDKGVAVSAVIGSFQGRDYLNELTVIGSALPGGGNNVAGGAPVGGGSYASRSAETQFSIHRQVALKAGLEYLSRAETPSESDVIASARIFERFLNEPFGEGDVEAAA